jgi:L-threonylcarbamoyladenylate synthase
LATRWWPGALTLIVPATGELARLVGAEDPTVGLRCPDHAFVAALCAGSGPLAVTSANRHGERPCTTAAEVLVVFATGPGSTVWLVVDGGTCAEPPSTVVDCSTEPPRCLRPGALAWADLVGSLE